MFRSAVRTPLASLAGVIGLAVGGQAVAHAHLVASDPAAGSSVATTRTVTLHMSETLEPRFSGLDLARTGGAPVAARVAVPEGDRKAIVAETAAPLAAGSYTVRWHAVSTDGHRTRGEFAFKVR